jgi:hypothetical protein
MRDADLSCREENRRDDLRKASLFGLDYVEVSDDQLTVYVYFLGKAPAHIEKANIRLTGGRRIQDVRVVNLTVNRQTDPTLDDFMQVVVNKPGDFSTYIISVVTIDEKGNATNQPMAGFDARYDQVRFSFKASCSTGMDCKPDHGCPPTLQTQPEINYLAKDYASFRQLILDRLAFTMPQWKETHVPDLGIALVEVLAYVGDYLSYYQDAVATEAYLGTARQRISVRRHARLVDYQMHEGCNARAWVTVHTDTTTSFDPTQIYFVTHFPAAPSRNILTAADLVNVPPSSYDVFQPLLPAGGTLWVYQAQSEIHFYTWGDCQCCLAKGATCATLMDNWLPNTPPTDGNAPRATAPTRALNLHVGDVLIFEEVLGPKTGNMADADPTHRQAVRLTKVTPAIDSLYSPDGSSNGQPIVEIEWAQEDALTFTLCISTQAPPPDCNCLENVTVVRGNVVLVDNGGTTTETLGTVPTVSTTQTCATACKPAEITVTPGLFRPTLTQQPLTFSQPLPICGSAAALSIQDPRQAVPAITLASTPPPAAWIPQQDLLESGPNDGSFVAEIDDDGYGHLRFGDGSLGRLPDAGSQFTATYRTGNGTAGNVGAETIRYIVLKETLSGVSLLPRNPLPAGGGTDPEPVSEVKLIAPYAFKDVLERAITADDYATLTGDNARRLEQRSAKLCAIPFTGLQGAKATLRWTGSWYTALVALDPLGEEQSPPELVREVTKYLEPYRRVGNDLLVSQAEYVPLDVALTVCVLSGYQRAHVEAALLDVFSSGVRKNGSLGFFHPNNLTFGEGIFVSSIVAAAQAVAGVQNVAVTRLERWSFIESTATQTAAEQLPANNILTLGPLEIPRLDNDPNFPENGRLTLTMRGGR